MKQRTKNTQKKNTLPLRNSNKADSSQVRLMKKEKMENTEDFKNGKENKTPDGGERLRRPPPAALQ